MTPKEAAEQIVLKYGELITTYPNKRLSKSCAILHCQGIIDELDMMHKPEYVTFITKYPDANYPEEGNGAETEDGYGRKEFWEQVLNEINKL